ncbi:uncharacterized protein BKA55DRAFT_569427 [Fusarium redolens]|uniref:F-box domain-containing protein n=1 Tax=Fusarium redolens TaxID=48865 RepID=A0A9P9H1C8_FUSRE|nr:uncharacterized protein BKA55DRAFT_569427 [Fusarium redolens]KAH7248558.1 hypothetical protein BKA55DRAFT_569427 [Fusarium redolens]
MPLLQLPPETLRQIFDQLDSSFFHEDLGRLTICKQWFDFALPACLKCIALSQEVLRNLIISTAIKKPSPLENSLETLDLNLRGYQYGISTPYGNPVKTSKKALNDDLAQLAIIVQQSHRLRTLCVRAWSSSSPNALSRPEDYLSLSTVRALLSVENLSVLVLDLSGSSLNPSGQQGHECHICPSIGALLHTLRTLHLRMRSICPDVLKTQNLDSTLHLSTVAINLSLIADQPNLTSAAHSKPCGSQGGGLIQLQADIREQAEALVTRMASPKTMRILTHSLPLFEIKSLDILTGKRMILDDDAAWDDDGKTVQEDSEPESEILDEDFAGFLDD